MGKWEWGFYSMYRYSEERKRVFLSSESNPFAKIEKKNNLDYVCSTFKFWIKIDPDIVQIENIK